MRVCVALTALLFLPMATSAVAMCGGSMNSGSARTAAKGSGMQCMDGMNMGSMSAGSSAAKQDQAKPDDPHAGMDMGQGSGAASGQMKMAGGCCCCGGMSSGGAKGGMCGQQAAMPAEDGSNDPLVNDPMWSKPKSNQSFAPDKK